MSVAGSASPSSGGQIQRGRDALSRDPAHDPRPPITQPRADSTERQPDIGSTKQAATRTHHPRSVRGTDTPTDTRPRHQRILRTCSGRSSLVPPLGVPGDDQCTEVPPNPPTSKRPCSSGLTKSPARHRKPVAWSCHSRRRTGGEAQARHPPVAAPPGHRRPQRPHGRYGQNAPGDVGGHGHSGHAAATQRPRGGHAGRIRWPRRHRVATANRTAWPRPIGPGGHRVALGHGHPPLATHVIGFAEM